MNRVKILFLIHDLGQGGAEKVLVNLVNNMDATKFDITVMSLFGGGVNEQFLKPNIKYKTVFKKTFPGNSKIMKVLSPKALHNLFIKDKYDIEVSYLEGPSARIISGCNNKDAKLVCWIHSTQHAEQKSSSSFRTYNESNNCYKKFNKIITVSDFVKESFNTIYPEITNIETLYNVLESDKILKLKEESVECFNENEFNIIAVGKIEKNKGVDKMARILKRLRDEKYSVHWYALGKGSYKNTLEVYLKENKLENYFTFLGYQTNPYKYVAKSDLFVCASNSEGFSTAATEALIVGTPVITTPVSGMEEMLGKNNEYGMISEMSEDSLYGGIKKLLDNSELLKHYKEKAKERGKMFSTEKTVEGVENMLLTLMENG